MEPPADESDVLNSKNCIICSKPLIQEQRPYVNNPTYEGLKKVIDCAELRDDEVHKRVSPHKEDILGFKIQVSYHKLCRASYASKTNIKGPDATRNQSEASSTPATLSGRLSREDTISFNVRRDCFICGKDRVRPESLTSISTGTGKTTRDKVLHAAQERADEEVQLRMQAYHDLFAFDAKYHRSCLAHYISDRNVAAAKRKHLNEEKVSIHDKAFDALIEQIDQTLLSQDVNVTSLRSLREHFENNLKILSTDAAKYASWKLKEKLLKHYKDKLVFVERPGKSDLVCSTNLPIGLAMREAALLKENETKESDTVNLECHPTMTETNILHMAAGVLRKTMAEVKQDAGFYKSSEDLSFRSCQDYVPSILYDFVNWCVDKNAHTTAQTCDEPSSKENLCVIAICQDIIAQCRQMHTPITLGLAIMLHHEFGSKALINELHAMGHCVSYNEVRQFLTSVAADQITRNEGTYIPTGLSGISDHGMIDAAIDNFDQNEETLDGKQTTHAMATVIYRRGETTTEVHHLARIPQKSLSALNDYDVDGEALHR